jgi:hypothetical protein
LREALGQLAGLKRRKLALEMLGNAVQSGLNKRDKETKKVSDEKESEAGTKRSRDSLDAETLQEDADTEVEEPAAKKSRTSTETVEAL